MRHSRFLAFSLFLAFALAPGTTRSDSPTRVATSIFVTDAGGFLIRIAQLQKIDATYHVTNYNLPAEPHMMSGYALNVSGCTPSANDIIDIQKGLSDILSSAAKDKTSMDQAYFEPFTTNYVVIDTPAPVAFFSAQQESKGKVIGSEKAHRLGGLLREVASKCQSETRYTYEEQIDLTARVLEDLLNLPQIARLRPSLAKGLSALGRWDQNLLRDQDPRVRQVFVHSLSAFQCPNARKWLATALEDSDPEVVTWALFGIASLPKEQRDAELQEKVSQIMRERWDDVSGEFGQTIGFKYPIRQIAECILKQWNEESFEIGKCY